VRGDSKSLACKSKPLLGGCLDADTVKIHPDRACDVLAHQRNVRCELRRLCKHRCVDISDPPARIVHESGNVG